MIKYLNPEDALPVHSNSVVAHRKAERQRVALNAKTKKAIESGNPQKVIDSLTGKQLAFVEEYLVDLNASQAVLRAGYKTNNPRQMGSQLLENPGIRIAIDALKAERSKNSDVTKDKVLKGILKAIEMAEEAKNVGGMLRGQELLARHLGMFIERTEISGPDGDAIRMEQKLREDVADFTSTIASLAKRAGKN